MSLLGSARLPPLRLLLGSLRAGNAEASAHLLPKRADGLTTISVHALRAPRPNGSSRLQCVLDVLLLAPLRHIDRIHQAHLTIAVWKARPCR